MPIRLTCPSCSATLSVKDEFAGRAVKCPKCGGVIPASQPATPAAATPVAPPPAATSPPPAPAAEAAPAEKAPLDDFDEPAKPAKTGGKITGKPVARSKGADEDEDRPRETTTMTTRTTARVVNATRMKTRTTPKARNAMVTTRTATETAPRNGGVGTTMTTMARHAAAAASKPSGGSNTPIILAHCWRLPAHLLRRRRLRRLLVHEQGQGDRREGQAKESKSTNFSSEPVELQRPPKVGASTRGQVDLTLGDGKVATTDDLKLAFGTDTKKVEAWTPKVDDGRAIIWRNNDDFILAAFHPGADAAARLQAKEWRPKSAGNASDGELDDAKFLEKFPHRRAGQHTGRADEEPPAGRSPRSTPRIWLRHSRTTKRTPTASTRTSGCSLRGRCWKAPARGDGVAGRLAHRPLDA